MKTLQMDSKSIEMRRDILVTQFSAKCRHRESRFRCAGIETSEGRTGFSGRPSVALWRVEVMPPYERR